MSFPNIAFKATNTNLDPTLQGLVIDKFKTLEKFVGEETDVKCEVEFEKETDSKTGDIFRVEANLWLHGHMNRAESSRDSFEKAIDSTRNELEKVLRRAHKRRHSLVRRGGRKIKQMLRMGE